MKSDQEEISSSENSSTFKVHCKPQNVSKKCIINIPGHGSALISNFEEQDFKDELKKIN